MTALIRSATWFNPLISIRSSHTDKTSVPHADDRVLAFGKIE
jgi:hypothetical protein